MSSARLGWMWALTMLVGAPAALASPVRLQLRVDRSTLRVGETTAVGIEFLDQDFRPVANDQDRLVHLEVRVVSGGSGRGDISPSAVKVPAGASSCTDARFTARGTGTLTVRAESDGLAPAEGFVRIVAPVASLFSRLLFPVVHAQGPAFQIQRSSSHPVANGRGPALLRLALDEPLKEGSLRVKITTDPPVTVLYGGTRLQRVAIVEIKEGADASDQIGLLCSQAGTVKVHGQVLPSGPTDDAEVVFEPPRPTKLLLTRPDGSEQAQAISSSRRVLPLLVRVGDQERVPMETLTSTHDVELLPATSHVTFGVQLQPNVIKLVAGHSQRQSNLRLTGLPFSEEIRILAQDRDADRDLEPGEMTVTVVADHLAIVLLAGVGGILGGLARYVYQVRTARLWPRRVHGRLDPGLVGNALFSVLFGLVLFLAVKLGVLDAIKLAPAVDSVALAFFLGVMGGFGGIVVLQRLMARVLPAPV